jgi:hypothetical protein
MYGGAANWIHGSSIFKRNLFSGALFILIKDLSELAYALEKVKTTGS